MLLFPPYVGRHSVDFKGPKIPFGAGILFLPMGPLADEQHTFSAKTRLGICMGYVTVTNGKFKGDVLVLDAQALTEAYRAN